MPSPQTLNKAYLIGPVASFVRGAGHSNLRIALGEQHGTVRILVPEGPNAAYLATTLGDDPTTFNVAIEATVSADDDGEPGLRLDRVLWLQRRRSAPTTTKEA